MRIVRFPDRSLPSCRPDSAPDRIIYPSHARDVHLVLGPAAYGKLIRFRVRIDGQAPGVNHGVDTDGQGNGSIIEYRLYQVIRAEERC